MSAANRIQSMWKARDELSPRCFRLASVPLALVLLLSIITGAMRYLDQRLVILGMDSNNLTQIAFGLGFLPMIFIKERHTRLMLRVSVIAQAALLAAQLTMPYGIPRFYAYVSFHFANGVSTACGLYLFAFALNNVERLFTMLAAQVYFALSYLLFQSEPVAAFLRGAGSVVIMLGLAAVSFLIKGPARPEGEEQFKPDAVEPPGSGAKQLSRAGVTDPLRTDSGESRERTLTGPGARESGIAAVIALSVVYYIITLMTLYIEYQEQTVSSTLYGIGGVVSVAVILAVMLFFNYSALHLWSLCLACTVLGVGALHYKAGIAVNGGSLLYGIGEGLGFMIVYYLQGGALKRSGSFRLLRLCCLFFFLNYAVISGVFFAFFDRMDAANLTLAFPAVLVLEVVCLLIAPMLYNRLFRTDWTDGYHMADMPLYTQALRQIEQIDKEKDLDLTPREMEIFLLLLTDAPYKHIADTLSLNINTVKWHSKNLYRKLNIQSRPELFAQYGHRGQPH